MNEIPYRGMGRNRASNRVPREDFYRRYKVELYCSLPCCTKENVDRKRGEGTFWKSIRALHLLNDAGYGKDQSLVLYLVYNPGGTFLPPPTQELEED